MTYSNLMKIHAHLKALQEQQTRNVLFVLYDDWSGAFGYNHLYDGFTELESFNSFEELEKIINEQPEM